MLTVPGEGGGTEAQIHFLLLGKFNRNLHFISFCYLAVQFSKIAEIVC
jgi:hypothetical protein